MHRSKGWGRFMGTLLCAGFVMVAPGLALAQAPAASPPDARAILVGMAEFLAKTQAMSASVQGAYDAVQTSGLKVEWNVKGTVAVRRPDRLRAESEQSNGARGRNGLTAVEPKDAFLVRAREIGRLEFG